MTFDEAKTIFLNRGYIEVNGGSYFDGNKWRESVVVISEWLKEEPCTDAISRQAVIDGINEYFHDEYYQRTSIQDCRDCLIKDVINELPSVNPQPKITVCEDAVSRQAVEDAIANMNVNGESLGYAVAYDILCDLPSVNPQPKTGHWIRQTDEHYDYYYECDQCGIAIGFDDIKNFCPNCGIKMINEEK